MKTERICQLIDENKEELFELLGSFVKINSENYRTGGNEKELAELIHKMSLELGLKSDIYSPLDLEGFKNHPDYVDGRHLENRYNVTVAYKGETDENGLMLMAHTDTVEIGDRSNWRFDPLSGEVEDGKPIILEVMREFKDRRTAELEANPYYKGSDIPKTCMRYMDIRAGKSGTDLDRGEIFFTYYTVKSREEINAEFAELERTLNERLAPLGIVGDGFVPRTRFFHYTYIPTDHEAIRTFLDAGKEAVGYAPTVCGSCLSDLSVIGKYGGGAAFMYGCARGFDSPGGAHQANEYISCDALVDFTKTVAAYVLKVLG